MGARRRHRRLRPPAVRGAAALRQQHRRPDAGPHGQPLTRWASAHLVTALDLAVRGRGWPADQAARALLQVAADPSTRSPARVAEAGPWWDEPATTTDTALAVDASALEAELDAVDGQRLQVRQHACEQLTAEGRPVTRLTVLQRAVDLLHIR